MKEQNPLVKVQAVSLNGMNVLLSNDYFLSTSTENVLHIDFDGNYRLTIKIKQLDSSVERGSYKNIEALSDEGGDRCSVFMINYTKSDSEFSLVKREAKVFRRKRDVEGVLIAELVSFKFMLEPKGSNVILFRLMVVSERVDE